MIGRVWVILNMIANSVIQKRSNQTPKFDEVNEVTILYPQVVQCVDSSKWELSHQPIEHQELEGAMLQGTPLSFRRPGGWGWAIREAV